MQETLIFIFLFCLFAVSWILVAGYHLGIAGFVSLASTSAGSSAMIGAYTGAALSIIFVGMIAFASVTKK